MRATACCRAGIVPADRRVRRLDGRDARCLTPAAAARLRALSRPDEHLRRPRQPAAARAALRLARHRLRAGRGRPRRRDRSRRARPLLPRRRPGPRPAAVRRGPASTKRDALHEAAARGAAILGVCGGYQLLGHGYELGDARDPGIGLLDLHTVRVRRAAPDRQRRDRGRAAGARGPARAGRVREPRRPHAPRRRTRSRSGASCAGTATTAARGSRASRSGAVIGTYLHGPLLPKNAWFADWLVTTALGLERAARAARRRARGRGARGRASRRRRLSAAR